jgi:hypothetical protein
VLADVRAGMVSVEAAAEHYGVVVDERLDIDEPATTVAREQNQ